jgi:hypothetical protein
VKYQCTFCADVKSHAWRCTDCGMLVCDSCSKGGKSTAAGIAGRAVVGYATAGLSEIARLGFRKINQHCPGCGGDDLIRI